MKKHSKMLLAGIAVTLCLCTLLILPVGALGIEMSTGSVPAVDSIADLGQQMVNDLAILEEQGIDVTEIRTTFESGDLGTLHELMNELRDEGLIGDEGSFFQTGDDMYAGEYGPGGDRTGELKRKEQVEGHIGMLEEQGIDVTEIRTVFELGDMDAVRALMAELRDEYMPEGAVNCCEREDVTDSGRIS
jgi:hypothetical protein